MGLAGGLEKLTSGPGSPQLQGPKTAEMAKSIQNRLRGPFQKPRNIENAAIGVGANPTLSTNKIEAKGGPLPAFFHAHFAGEPPDPPQTAKTGGSLQNLPESPPKRQILGKKGGGVLPKICLKVPPEPQN